MSIEERPKRYVFRCFLKFAIEVAVQTDSGRLFERRGTRVKCPCICVALDPCKCKCK